MIKKLLFVTSILLVFCFAAVAASVVLAGPVMASVGDVTVKVTVSAAGLKLAESADVREVLVVSWQESIRREMKSSGGSSHQK